MVAYWCHGCEQSFHVEIGSDYGTYEFRWCPHCGSGKTTFAQ